VHHDSKGQAEQGYVTPTVSDLGDLQSITAGFQGTGGPDAMFPGDPIFPDNSPAFGP